MKLYFQFIMMSIFNYKFALVLVVSMLTASSVYSQVSEEVTQFSSPYLLQEPCLDAINEHVGWELYASIVYLNMAAHFGRPAVAKPGYAKFFRDQSEEEFRHANKFIDYVIARNGNIKPIQIDHSPKAEWEGPKQALEDAIKLENHVFGRIQHIHDIAEQKCQDADLTDFLEGYFYKEQIQSITELKEMLKIIDTGDSSSSLVIQHMEDAKLRPSKKEL